MPEEAGGIEAAASTGGQILPPIMGAGAFLIAEYTGLPYLEVVKAATRSRDSLHGNRIRLRAPCGGREGSQGSSSLRASPVREHVGKGLALPCGPGGADDRAVHGFFGGPGRIPFVPNGGGTGGLASLMGPNLTRESRGLEAGRSGSATPGWLGRRRDSTHCGWFRHCGPKCTSSQSGLRRGGNHRGHRRPHGSGPQIFGPHAFSFPGESLSCPDTCCFWRVSCSGWDFP